MANILNKVIKLKKKEFKLKMRLLGLPAGSLCYILKRDGSTKPFTILAIMESWDEVFSKFRQSDTIHFAAYPDETFQPFATPRTMRKIAEIGTHMAIGGPTEFRIYEIRNGDDWLPRFFDWTYTFFIRPVKGDFVPADNEDS